MSRWLTPDFGLGHEDVTMPPVRGPKAEGDGLRIFRNAVAAVS